MCGRYAASRSPEDLVEEFEVDHVDRRLAATGGDILQRLERDYNVAPTKPVPAIVTRRPHRERDADPVRQLTVLRWGLVPSWAKDPKIGSRMINARTETVADKPAFKRAFAARRCLLPADGYYEWYETDQRTAKGKPVKQPFFIHPRDGGVLAMAGLYEIWRDPDKDKTEPDAFWWTSTVLTTTAEDELGHLHDRMPLLVEPDRWDTWLDPALDGTAERDTLLGSARARGARAAPGLPGVPRGQLRAEQRPAAGRPAAGGRGLSVAVKARLTTIETPHGPARVHRHQASLPVATLLLGHGAGGGVGAVDLQRLAQLLPRRGITVVLVEQPWRVAGKRVASAPPVLDVCFRAVADHLRPRNPVLVGGRSAGARVACRTAAQVGAVGVLALAFPLHPPGRPERSRAGELTAVGLPTLVVQGSRDPFATPTELAPFRTPRRRLVVVPGADHGFAVRAGDGGREAADAALDAVAVVVGDWALQHAGLTV